MWPGRGRKKKSYSTDVHGNPNEGGGGGGGEVCCYLIHYLVLNILLCVRCTLNPPCSVKLHTVFHTIGPSFF